MYYKPVPTDYRGQTFKSKSEAILARSFDLCKEITKNGFIWMYEPEMVSFKDYIPDFQVVFQSSSKSKFIVSFLIEYKPSKPSESYLNKFIQYDEYLQTLNFPFYVAPMIVYGSMFDDDPQLKKLQYWHDKDGAKNYWEESSFTVFGADTIREAKQYRFDLLG